MYIVSNLVEWAAMAARPRPYLRAADRRRQLLDAAARVAGRDGIGGLTIVGVAGEAGVSRQLVYEHFGDVAGLVGALLADRFGDLRAEMAEAMQAGAARPGEVALMGARHLLGRPAPDRHLIRALMAYAAVPGHELSNLATAQRELIIDRWAGRLRPGQPGPSRAQIWAIINAMLGLGDLVDSGAITIDEAVAELAVLFAAVTPPAAGDAASSTG